MICKQFGYLYHLTNCSPHQRNLSLATATPEQVHAICEVCTNLLKGTIPISHNQKERIRGHADKIRNLADSSIPFKDKKKIIAQEGSGFLTDVVSPLMSTLGMFLV